MEIYKNQSLGLSRQVVPESRTNKIDAEMHEGEAQYLNLLIKKGRWYLSSSS